MDCPAASRGYHERTAALRGLARMASALTDALPEVTGVSLALTEETTLEQWVAYGETLGRAGRWLGWQIGDWLNFGERKYGESYELGIKATGLDRATLHSYASVAKKIEPLRRRKELSFDHHRTVMALPQPEQDAILEQAEASGWSRNDLRKAIKGEPLVPSVEELMQQIERFVDGKADFWPDDSPQKIGRFLSQLGKKYDDGTKLRFNLIRYPGAKGKLAKIVQRHMPDRMAGKLYNQGAEVDYREPFFGSGAVGLRLMAHAMTPEHSRVWINDIDQSIGALWSAIKEEPEALQDLVREFTPSLEAFQQFKEEDGGIGLHAGFQKLALHQMSFSGCGYMGGPIGGLEGNPKNPIGCRWNAGGICQSIRSISALMQQFPVCFITSLPWQEVVQDAGENCFMYLDPPYYEKGEQLYRYAMNDSDHSELAESLRGTQADWVLSYDDHARIRELYSWAKIEEISVTYSAETKVRERTHELIITPRRPA